MNDPHRRLFAHDAASYARYRPDYPEALFSWIAGHAPGRGLAWDCATGSGQAARGLATHFGHVVASDVSLEQIRAAGRAPRIAFFASSEHVGLASASVDAIAIAQALHWFPSDTFYAEARRVLVAGGLLVAWSYHLSRVTPSVDAVMDRYYRELLGPYWPEPIQHVENGYAKLPFPFERIATPPWTMTKRWRLADLEGYLGTWSASAKFKAATGTEPLALFRPEFRAAWGDPAVTREVTWPLAVLAGYSEG